MKAKIDPSRCVGCGLCVESLPQVFFMGPFYALSRQRTLSPQEESLVVQIAEDCPSGALSFEEDEVPSLMGGATRDGYNESNHDE